jgi:hypothetical protein
MTPAVISKAHASIPGLVGIDACCGGQHSSHKAPGFGDQSQRLDDHPHCNSQDQARAAPG